MGLFSFVKSAGEKLFGGKDEPKAPEKGTAEDSEARERFEALVAKQRAAAISTAISKNQLEVADLDVSVDGDTATLKGSAPNQETREKAILVAGNVNGIASVDDQLTVESTEPEATFYTVERGDTLGKIAQEHYGKASKYPVIFEANKPMLTDPDKIYPGQVLRIPALDD
ncbi:MAG: peptidoglycan-binding protein LysM [Acidobacteriota bacterium]